MGSVTEGGSQVRTAVTGAVTPTSRQQRGEGPAGEGGVFLVCCLQGLGDSEQQASRGSGLPAHTADRSTRCAEWLLLSQGPSLVEPVPGRVPFIMSELKGFTLAWRAELLVRDQTLVLCLKAALTSEFRRQ